MCIKWRHSHDNSRETQYRNARFVYLSNDTFRIKATDKTLKHSHDAQYHDNERKYL